MGEVMVHVLNYLQTITIMPNKGGETFNTELDLFQHDSFSGKLRGEANNCIIFNADFDALQNFANEFGIEHFVFGKKLDDDELIWEYYKKDNGKFKRMMKSYGFGEIMTGGSPSYKMKGFGISIPFFEEGEKEVEGELMKKIKKFVEPFAKADYFKGKKVD
ncbi:hypothetical protein DWQ65_03030 [Treponema phagedenis]|uniref:Uncharacterized protein n=1 Tax=Treponema phagedenis TaxID=162 RepID=A0A0B7H0F7_TREPH|nr:hypothetical protein [Treponema phagedenis]NVP24678.1 hypothetical protein [Treponema phagedenis]QEJ95696.1 hypothetical protein FUT79_11095 [Treponema phagedenis]QEJ97574.1 hypothetical protein FUT82_05870 [Treponema phagedenis]QEK00540.1 hypothetical protein FUT84_04700 [Treponema phagedenis]QEK03139.1 hypothetical protein FUT83_04460 [Treponema phagedenis]